MSTEVKAILTVVVALAAVAFVAGTASAQFPPPLVTVDENGHGTFVYAGDTDPISWTVGQDTGPGGLPNALLYFGDGASFLPGDVLILESPTGGLSDLVRFNSDGTGVFYSDNSDGADSLADVGFPTESYQLQASIFEVGSEGNSGAFYTPNSDQPGYVSEFPGLTYHFISDQVVPEPATLALLGTGAVGLIGFIRRRNMK